MTDDRPVAPQIVRAHIEGCEKRWEKNEARMRAMEERSMEHGMRLENGTHAFQRLRDDHSTMGTEFAKQVAKLTPKPPSVPKIAMIVFGIFATAAGGLWVLSETINDRPTTTQIREIMHDHQVNGHKATQEDLKNLRETQIEQGGAIKTLTEKVDDQVGKLDQLIELSSDGKKKKK